MAAIDVTRTESAGRGEPADADGRRHGLMMERTGFRLSWGAIFAGFVVATALQMVFTTLGAAIGLTAFDPGQGDSASSLGIGAVVWFAITAVASMFIGGMTTGRLAGILTRPDGMLHGVIMWSLSLLLALYMASVGLGRVLGGVTSFVTSSTSAAVGGVASAAGSVGSEVVREQGSEGARSQVSQTVDQARQKGGEVADQAANVTSKGLWGALLLMGLSVAAAAFGAGSKARE